MSALLKAPADLLWFGGIGTYVRASDETDDQVGDRANDAIRVTGAGTRRQGDRRGRQPRHDAARAHRVRQARRPPQHRLHRQLRRRQFVGPGSQHQDRAAPGGRRRQAADERAQQPARQHDRRSRRGGPAQQLSAEPRTQPGIASRNCRDAGARAVDDRARGDRRSRSPHRVPADRCRTGRAPQGRAAADPAGTGGTAARGRRSISMRGCWRATSPTTPTWLPLLVRYFPQTLRAAYPQAINQHRLRREIIATGLANDMVNRGGATMSSSLAEETGRAARPDRPCLCRRDGGVRTRPAVAAHRCT